MTEKTQQLRETTIPFDGFYNSTSDEHVDSAYEQYFDVEGTGDPEFLASEFHYMMDFSNCQNEGAKIYHDAFLTWFEEQTEIKLDATYDTMESPREYNFTTDIIFTKLTMETVQKLFDYVDQHELSARIVDRFTSCSGFISFYSNDVLEWLKKPLNTWDCNEVGTLIEAAIIQALEGEYSFSEMIQQVWDTDYAYETIDNFVVGEIGKQIFDVPDKRKKYFLSLAEDNTDGRPLEIQAAEWEKKWGER